MVTISERVPIFGEVNITLKHDSSIYFKKFQDDIDRLEKINQLGILHNFLKIPPYTKKDYILVLLYLIETAAKSNNLNRFFKKKMKILNANFDSIEDLLKSWALIYSLGHLQMTFAAEHAFLKTIVSNDDYLSQCRDEITDFFKSSEIFKGNTLQNGKKEDNNKLKEILDSFVSKQKIMEVYKLFTLFKVEKSIKNRDNEEKLIELVKLMVFKEEYLDNLSLNYPQEQFTLKRKIHLKKVIAYFECIRLIAFTILDGSISQGYLNLNYISILNNLDKFIENDDYKTLLNDMNKFYTADIYDSPESMYYHHYCVNKILDNIFENELCNKKDKIKHVLANMEYFDSCIENEIKNVEKDIRENNRDYIESEESYIKKELKNHIRLTLEKDLIDNPVKIESEIFKWDQKSIFGGLIFNLPKNSIEIDFYPNSKQSNRERYVYSFLNAIIPIYNQLKSKELVYEEIYGKIGSSEKQKEAAYKIVNERFIKFLSIFRESSHYLMKILFEPTIDFSSWKLGDQNIHFPILIDSTQLKKFVMLLKERLDTDNMEYQKNIDVLNTELKKSDGEDFFYLFAPNSQFHINNDPETEIDCLLVRFSIKENKMVIILGEIKRSNNGFSEEQSVKQLKTGFNLSELDSKFMYSSTREFKEFDFKTKYKGQEEDNLLIFKRYENI